MQKKSKTQVAAQIAPKNSGGWTGKAHGLAEKFEKIVNAVAAPLPSPRIRLWLAGFFHPDETYGKVEKNATLVGMTINLLIFYIAYSTIFFLFMLALTTILPADDLLSMGLQKNPDIVKIALGSLVLSPVVSAFFAMFAFAAVFASARVLGGKGTYVKQANSMSLVLCGSNMMLLVLMCLAFAIFMPSFILRDSEIAGAIVSIATLLASIPVLLMCLAILLYSIYAHYLVVRKAHDLSSWRAAGAMAIAAVFIVLLDIVLNAALA